MANKNEPAFASAGHDGMSKREMVAMNFIIASMPKGYLTDVSRPLSEQSLIRNAYRLADNFLLTDQEQETALANKNKELNKKTT